MKKVIILDHWRVSKSMLLNSVFKTLHGGGYEVKGRPDSGKPLTEIEQWNAAIDARKAAKRNPTKE